MRKNTENIGNEKLIKTYEPVVDAYKDASERDIKTYLAWEKGRNNIKIAVINTPKIESFKK